ncbi:MAG: tRNA (guanosine(37)-N1)-methyltransferase TrmD [Candidatus Ancillula sp.]|jgi:tRNA (guanine37-N1)-methyltransferase|nr:tRNA (guanosine(37)-N1)-methyltransferase TrmD [Candidatus Ancillula sp.]
MKRIDIITIFPEYFEPLKLSLIGRAIENGVLEVNTVKLRDFAAPPHHSVDDTPYGGGAGMVIKPDVLSSAIDSVLDDDAVLIFTSPAGIKFTQPLAHQLKGDEFKHLVFICGRFEGYDARVVEYYRASLGAGRVFEVSIGDYVLNGGEVAVLVMVEAISRLIPGVVGNPDSLVEESHELSEDGVALLEYPNYTRPADFRGLSVPEVLLSGNHKAISDWRRGQSAQRTNSV